MDAIECMKTRRSVRAYNTDVIPKEVIEDIVDTGRLAASAINIQPWQFIAVTNAEIRKSLSQITDHGKLSLMPQSVSSSSVKKASITSKMDLLQHKTFSMLLVLMVLDHAGLLETRNLTLRTSASCSGCPKTTN